MNRWPEHAAVTGFFIEAEVHLPSASAGFLAQLPYLGGVLHGAISQHLHQTAWPANAAWRLVAPPRRLVPGQGGAQVRWLSDEGNLRFGVVVHAADPMLCAALQGAVQALPWLGSEHERHRVAQVRCRVQDVPAPWLPAQSSAAVHPLQLHLTWLTPLHMASRAQAAAGHALQAPSLLRVVRSLARRAREWQPQWADQLGIGTAAWTAAEEQLRAVRVLGDALVPVRWRYGSRTQPNPHERLGLMGTQRFEATLSAAAMALLHWGPWLGVGEGATYGCGGYELHVEETFSA
jgi:hypothetical protein